MSTEKVNKAKIMDDLKKNVRSLLISSKTGLDPRQLMQDYANMLGHPMPLNILGFSNVVHMAMAMPDVVYVQQNFGGYPLLKAVSDPSTLHIEKLVAKQRMSKRKTIPPVRPLILPIAIFRAQLKQLLYQGPMMLSDLRDRYMQQFGFFLFPHKFGFKTLREMLYAVADMIFIFPAKNSDIIVLRENAWNDPPFWDRRNQFPNLTQSCASISFHQERPKRQPATVKKGLEADPPRSQTMVLESPSNEENTLVGNSHCPTVPAEEHVQQCNAAADCVETRVDSSQADGGGQCETFSLNEVSPEEGKINGDCEGGAGQNEILNTIEDSKASESAGIGSASEICIHPVDVLRDERLREPTRHCSRRMEAVQVEHVVSPGHFYISFPESTDASALLNMMLKMKQFYLFPGVSESYKLPERFIRPGQECCVKIADFWFYRVTIKQITSDSQVEVYLVDYGDTYTVNSADLKFLKTCFSVLPAQAVLSTLAGIKPTSGDWTPEATYSFQYMCNHILVGLLDCYIGDVLQIYLCDTRTSEDKYIHRALMSEGHAVPCRLPVFTESKEEEMPALELIVNSNM
ncbi:tudor domain-containing protein 5-like [Corythoichthys intestinalis]|uniref:tudor domain-containing protein 5-like n=1 Tax=Corythoichthys intestinalis TaxID=161448 RepID=UPI0025A5DF10|nr:tudor domain-containing protein 5-like [Corythoichthys intestinalis]